MDAVARSAVEQSSATLEGLAAKGHHLLWTAGGTALLVLVAAVTWPYLSSPWGVRPWFEGMYLAANFVLSLLIALFLVLHVLAGARTRALAWVSGGYAFTAAACVGIFLTFPGLIEPATSAAHPDSQVAAWLSIEWHIAFPCFLFAALWERGNPRRLSLASRQIAGLLDCFPVLLAAGVALISPALIEQYGTGLPAVMMGDAFNLSVATPIAWSVAAVNLVAFAMLVYVTRMRELMYLWLTAVLIGFSLEIVLTVAGGARYTAGWYVGHQLSLLAIGALMVALMLEHFRMHRYAELRASFHEQEAAHDWLTRLYNRRYLTERLEKEISRAKRDGQSISVLLIDVDRFKLVNDEEGHAAGDKCLRVIANALGDHIRRPGDFAARYGGEEFAVVLFGASPEGAIAVAEEIRRRVEILHVQFGLPRRLTVSIGVASKHPSWPASVEALLAGADECLYAAKAQGRNRVVSPVDLEGFVSGLKAGREA